MRASCGWIAAAAAAALLALAPAAAPAAVQARRGNLVPANFALSHATKGESYRTSNASPKKPACSDPTAKQLKSMFGFSFSRHPTAKRHQTKAVRHLECTWSSADPGDLTIDYDRYSSVATARAQYRSDRRALIREGKNQPPDIPSQLLPLINVRGIGDLALRSTDGTVIEFVDGIDTVRIENGFADLSYRMTLRMLALARYIGAHG
jgi:hypothetical protein